MPLKIYLVPSMLKYNEVPPMPFTEILVPSLLLSAHFLSSPKFSRSQGLMEVAGWECGSCGAAAAQAGQHSWSAKRRGHEHHRRLDQ